MERRATVLNFPKSPLYVTEDCFGANEFPLLHFISPSIIECSIIEYFYFNVLGAYVGENTPCFVTRIEDEDKK